MPILMLIILGVLYYLVCGVDKINTHNKIREEVMEMKMQTPADTYKAACELVQEASKLWDKFEEDGVDCPGVAVNEYLGIKYEPKDYRPLFPHGKEISKQDYLDKLARLKVYRTEDEQNAFHSWDACVGFQMPNDYLTFNQEVYDKLMVRQIEHNKHVKEMQEKYKYKW